jgi:DNA-binding transcriptional LysR family regulator
MNTRDLEAFLAVVETGSIVGASARLHLTQPGVSRRIQSLEEQLGVALLDRQSKPLKPTAAGRETYVHGRRMLRVLDDLKTGLSPKGVVSGEFRLGISPYLSEVGITTLADRLRDSFPDLTLRITTGWPEQLLEQLRRSEIDVAAFCLPDGMNPPTEIEADALDIQPLFVAASQSLDLSSPATLQDLSPFPWIIQPGRLRLPKCDPAPLRARAPPSANRYRGSQLGPSPISCRARARNHPGDKSCN